MLTETEFYDRLAEFFDVMTAWQSRLAVELPFIGSIFAQHNARSVLDCACGTGGHAIAFAQRGYSVAGSDISAAMIARAEANARRVGLSIPFKIARFQDLRTTFDEKFDAVLCLGNSFVHVLSDEDALASLSNMRDCLRSGGVLILHNLNYDKRMKDKPRWFAVNSGMLQNRETLVWRFADYDQTSMRITFNIALFSKDDKGAWSVQVQSTQQRPYQKNEIENLLERAGFHDVSFYGSLQGEPFNAEQSGDLVVVAKA
ncbi:MAG: class I SAM-dependent methyltransferase [Chloroflexi bacterium]|nr:class I SAM-dependent methyltransferase [Chloroflexota bacterium]